MPDLSCAASTGTDDGHPYQSSVPRQAYPGAHRQDRGFPAYEDYQGGDWGGRSGARRSHRHEDRGHREASWRGGPGSEQSFSNNWGYEGDFCTGYARSRQVGRRCIGNFRGRGLKNYQRSDARILEDVSEALQEDPYVDASDMEVQVHDGAVTLTGMVESRFAKHQAQGVADSVSGVRHVQNNLRGPILRKSTPIATSHHVVVEATEIFRC